jgi:hypothetical protein
MAARSIVSMRCANIWRDGKKPLSRASRIVLSETAEQLDLDGIERIRPMQAHNLAAPFRTDQLRDVVTSSFKRYLADYPLFVVIVSLIDSTRFLSDTQPLDFVVVASSRMMVLRLRQKHVMDDRIGCVPDLDDLLNPAARGPWIGVRLGGHGFP